MSSSPEDDFLTLLPLIERIIAFAAWRHGLFHADAEDFGSFVKSKLIEDDYAVLRSFQGRSSQRTFLTTVITNACKDFIYRTSTKWRPSAKAKRLGALCVLLEQLVARDGCAFDQAAEIIASNRRFTTTRAELERLAAELPARAPRRFVSDQVLAEMPAHGTAPDDLVVQAEREQRFERATAVLQSVKATLPAEDQLILALRFEDGLTVAEIATTLGVQQKPLYRRLESLFARVRIAMESHGVTTVDLGLDDQP